MELQTISKVSKFYGISTRTLRYYEQIGLISSTRTEDFAYRSYDEYAVLRLQQIILLRKLRIPLKQIKDILASGDVAVAIEAFEHNLAEIEDEITALSTIRSVISVFLQRLNLSGKVVLLDDKSLLEVVDALTASKINFKEDKTMDELNKANEKLNKRLNVRIIYLPPATVASAHVIGYNPNGDEEEYYPEAHTGLLLRNFIDDNKLPDVKPDFRKFGFNHPVGSKHGAMCGDHGYEHWVTIPDNMDVPAPMTKKHFCGGLYAAYTSPYHDYYDSWDEWAWLWEWVEGSEQYALNAGDTECWNGILEEHLNAFTHYSKPRKANFDGSGIQYDLLIPVKER